MWRWLIWHWKPNSVTSQQLFVHRITSSLTSRLLVCSFPVCSARISLTNWWGGVGVRGRIVWNFAQGLKFKADFHSKMSVCRHELGGSTPLLFDNSHPLCLSSFLFVIFRHDISLNTEWMVSAGMMHTPGIIGKLQWQLADDAYLESGCRNKWLMWVPALSPGGRLKCYNPSVRMSGAMAGPPPRTILNFWKIEMTSSGAWILNVILCQPAREGGWRLDVFITTVMKTILAWQGCVCTNLTTNPLLPWPQAWFN